MNKVFILLGLILLAGGCKKADPAQANDHAQVAVHDQKLVEGFRGLRATLPAKGRAILNLADGVDQFEAWVLADEFRGTVFGGCGNTQAPRLREAKWIVPIAVGFPPEQRHPVVIDAKTGRIDCDGFEPIIEVEKWYVSHRAPAQAPIPTATGVTPAAGQEQRRS